MNWNSFLVVAAVGAGLMIPAQGIVNGRLAGLSGGPLQAALISFGVGFSALVVINLALRHSLPSMSTAIEAPPWIWVGGLMGVVMVTLAAAAVPRIGVATYVSAVIAGQLTAALAYDHYGVLGQTMREATPLRILGGLLMAAGVYLIRRF